MHHLMDHPLRHRERTVTDLDGQQQLAHRVDRRPDPIGRPRQALDRFGLTHLPSFDGTEQGKEFVQLHLGDVHIVQKMLGNCCCVVSGVDQPL
jgi:hypothetical protein